jgi:hypothetical protein
MSIVKINGDKETALKHADLPTRGIRELAITEDNRLIAIDGCGNYVIIPEETLSCEPLISKETFLNHIEEIRKYYKKIDNINKVLLENCTDSIYCPPTLEDVFIDLMAKALDDKYNAIIYFIYELNFGIKWKPKSFMIKGTDIKLQSTEDVYNFLMSELND